jgi:predicted nucleic acid-binding protein
MRLESYGVLSAYPQSSQNIRKCSYLSLYEHSQAAELYAELRASGQLIEDADLLIAAMVLVHDMTLVTNNTAHFTRITSLQIEDWLIF